MQKFLNRIICGDCIEVLGKVDEPFADLIFADPPFNIGYKYDKYQDKVKSEKYVAWTKDWMSVCKRVLKPDGSFYIAIGDDYAANVKIIADELGLVMRNWLIWHYTFGQQTKDKFARSHTHIFYFVQDKKNFTFNDYAVRVPSDRQLIYNDRRANPKGKMPNDVWDSYSRVCGTFKERAGWHPCQMPQPLLERIVAVSSSKGDWVLDPFVGSGTTAAAAASLGRRYTGIEISPDYAEKAGERLADWRQPKSEQQKRPFLEAEELNELRRLLTDMGISAGQVTSDRGLLRIITKQLGVRMNNGRRYSIINIGTALSSV